MIKVEHVSMKFKLSSDKIQSLKEFAIAFIKRKLKYESFWVFQDLNFEVKKGEVVGIIGRNGAGKSTLLKIIAGVLEPSEGSVAITGNIVPMLELGSGFDVELSGRENIFLNGAILGYSEEFLKDKYDEIVEFSELGKFIESPIRNYSSGMLMRLAFSIATVVQPEILIVDEILAVGDEAFQRKSKKRMLELMSGGTTVLFVSHSIAQIKEMCNRVIWLEDGRIKMTGEAREVCDSYQDYLNPAVKDRKNNDADKTSMDVLFVYGTFSESYMWRIKTQREQLLAGNICSNECYYEDLTLEMAKNYRIFIFSFCPFTEAIEVFMKKVKSYHKRILFDLSAALIDGMCSMADYDLSTEEQKELLIQNREFHKKLNAYCDGCISSHEGIASAWNQTDVFINPYRASEKLVQLSEWRIYDRDVLPNRDPNLFTNQDEVLNYKKAVFISEERKKRGMALGYFNETVFSPNFSLILPSVITIMEQHSSLELHLFGEAKLPPELHPYRNRILFQTCENAEELQNIICAVDILLNPLEDNPANQLVNESCWIRSALVKVPLITSSIGIYKKLIQHMETGLLCSSDFEWTTAIELLLSKQPIRESIAETAYHMVKQSHAAIYDSTALAEYIQSKWNHNMAFVLPNIQISGGVLVACKHCSFLYQLGLDIVLLSESDETEHIIQDGIELPVISKMKTGIWGSFDKVVATLWSTMDFLQLYSNIKKRYYLVQNFETDFYEAGEFSRIRANQTYHACFPVEYLTISKWCQNWLASRYHQIARYAPNGIDGANFKPKVRNFCEKIRILIEGNCDDPYKNVDESFEIVNQLDPERYEIWYLSYKGTPKPSYRVDRFFHKIPHRQISEIYRECHILLKSSTLESFSYPPLEMMATGGYVVVAPNGGNIEYLCNETNCLFYEPGNKEDAMDAIQRILSDPSLRETLYRNGLETAKKRDWNLIRNEILDLYQ